MAAGKALDDVPGLYIRGRGLQAPRIFERPLDRLPLPAPDLFDARLADNPSYFLPVQTRRGCPLRCSYCSTPALEGRRVRARAPGPAAFGNHYPEGRWSSTGGVLEITLRYTKLAKGSPACTRGMVSTWALGRPTRSSTRSAGERSRRSPDCGGRGQDDRGGVRCCRGCCGPRKSIYKP